MNKSTSDTSAVIDNARLYNTTYARLVRIAAVEWPVGDFHATPEEMGWGEADDIAIIEGTLLDAHEQAKRHVALVTTRANQRLASKGEPMWPHLARRMSFVNMEAFWRFEARMNALYTK